MFDLDKAREANYKYIDNPYARVIQLFNSKWLMSDKRYKLIREFTTLLKDFILILSAQQLITTIKRSFGEGETCNM